MAMSKKRRARNTPVSELIRNLRSLRILLLHPKDREAEDLLEHLNRIGCHVQTQWPPPKEVPPGIDVVFLALRQVVEDKIEFQWNADEPPAVLIAIVDYENPIIVEKVLQMKAQAVIGLPLRPFGVLANVLLSVTNHKREKRLLAYNDRLRSKLKAKNDIDKAKAILIQAHEISEARAYEFIREQAMNKRTTIESIASSIINASDLLQLNLTKDDVGK
jgi:AmiR/NasT family two-component response regulator